MSSLGGAPSDYEADVKALAAGLRNARAEVKVNKVDWSRPIELTTFRTPIPARLERLLDDGGAIISWQTPNERVRADVFSAESIAAGGVRNAPQAPREFWANEYKDYVSGCLYATPESADSYATTSRVRRILLREVP
jgi:hypothetical protein